MSSLVVTDSGSPVFDFASGAAKAENVQTATLADGDIVVTWQQTGGAGGTSIEAEILNPDGSIATPAFQVNTMSSGDPVSPSVAALSSGGFVVGWRDGDKGSNGSGQNILDQAFASTGAKAGGENVVNVTTKGDLSAPSVAGLTNGGYAVEF